MKDCKYCSKMHKWNMEKCPAYGKICDKCSKRNHFISFCQQKTQPHRTPQSRNSMQRNNPKVHELHTHLLPASEDELWVLSFPDQVNSVGGAKNQVYAAMEIGNKAVGMQVDTCHILKVKTERARNCNRFGAKPLKQQRMYCRVCFTRI